MYVSPGRTATQGPSGYVKEVPTPTAYGLDLQPVAEPAFDRLAKAYTRGRFCRDTSKLLTH